MSRKPTTSKTAKDISSSKTVSAAIEDIIFTPSQDQVKAKTAFWIKYSENPLADATNVSKEMAIRLSQDTRIGRWWGISGFREWFLNEDEFRQKIEFLVNLSLETAQQLLIDPDGNPNAKVNLMKLLFETAHKLPKKYEKIAYKDEQIHRMDQAQLEAFIRERSIGLGEADDKKKENK